MSRTPLMLMILLLAANAFAQSEQEAEALSSKAHQALLLQDYADAATAFAAEEALLRQGRLPGVDASIYWQAFVALKQGRQDEVRRQVERLRREFPRSDWLDDARALLPFGLPLTGLGALATSAKVPASQGVESGEATAMATIDALLGQEPRAASDTLRALIADHPTEDALVARALYVLNLIAPDDALTAARRLSDQPRVGSRTLANAYAILSASTDRTVQAEIRNRYPSLDQQYRRQVINAWAKAGQIDAVRAMLPLERDRNLRWHLINALAVLRDADSLIALARSGDPASDGLAAINGLAVMERADALIAMLDDPNLGALRLPIIRSLGTAGGAETPATLVRAYADSERSHRQAAVDSLAQLNAGEALLSLLRDEQDPQNRILLMTGIRRLHDAAVLNQAEALVRTQTR